MHLTLTCCQGYSGSNCPPGAYCIRRCRVHFVLGVVAGWRISFYRHLLMRVYTQVSLNWRTTMSERSFPPASEAVPNNDGSLETCIDVTHWDYYKDPSKQKDNVSLLVAKWKVGIYEAKDPRIGQSKRQPSSDDMKLIRLVYKNDQVILAQTLTYCCIRHIYVACAHAHCNSMSMSSFI